MNRVSTAAQIREMDRRVIEDTGVPGVALMEVAARAVAAAVRDRHLDEARRGVVVVCGGGNNGGDGYAVARWLRGWEIPVSVWPLTDDLQGDAATMREACRRTGVPFVEGLGDAGLIVDAIFGTGLSREVRGVQRAAIEAILGHSAPVVAVDLPSGLHADTGAALGVAVRAATTVTFGRLKPGLLAEPGADLAGELVIADIGLEVAGGETFAEVPDAADLSPLWPRRAAGDYKTRSGHLLVVAGSVAMAGAAVLACRGALSAGVGLCTLLAARATLLRLAALPPEVMVFVSGEDRLEPVSGGLSRFTALAAGPGLAGGADVDPAFARWLAHLWESTRLPVVFDADALPSALGGAPGARVITPHPGEAARRLGITAAAVQADRFGAVAQLATDGVAALLKGRHTLVAAEGHPISVNPTNATVLATGGSGDVLTGVIGALLARGVGARDAARLGAFVHGAAGMRLGARRAEGWTAADVALALPEAIADLVG